MTKLIIFLVIYAIGFIVTFIITRTYGIQWVKGKDIVPIKTSIMESLLWILFWFLMGVALVSVGIYQIARIIKEN